LYPRLRVVLGWIRYCEEIYHLSSKFKDPKRDPPSKSSVFGTLVRWVLFFRARALQDFAYALVKAEMDTDFEDECKEIVSRRQKATEKLKKIDKDHPELAPVSPSKMQVPMFIIFSFSANAPYHPLYLPYCM
jgi:hypothetical protein